MAALSQMAPNNDQMQQAQEFIQKTGGNAQNACYQWANDHGLDENAVMQAYQTAQQMFGNR